MEQFLSQLESSLGIPATLIERAAAARAAASGSTTENVVRSWAGAEAAPAGESPAPAPAAAAAPAAEAAPQPAAEAEPALAVEVLEAFAPLPEAADSGEEEEESQGLLVGFPGWLASAMVLVPLLALTYVLLAPNGPGCGTSGQLAIDAETGVAENCDGSPYGVSVFSFFGAGEEIYNGRCAACHGGDGGGGTGPAMAGGAVLVTFPSETCLEHIAWIALGSDNWPEPTYGATATPVGSSGANMPGFEGTLTAEELAAVVIYERVAFGGQVLGDAETDCGTDILEVAADG